MSTQSDNDSSYKRFLILLLSLVPVYFAPADLRAEIIFNARLRNTTGNVVNDYHVKLRADQNIDLSGIGSTGPLGAGPVTGNGTREVTASWSGGTVNQGQECSFSLNTAMGAGTPNGLTVAESWWTLGGIKVVSATSGRLGSAMFDGTSGSGDWVVARIMLYDSLSGANQIGTEWVEGRADSAVISNQTSDGPIFASWAFNTPGAFIPVQDLNDSLGGFGPPTPIQFLAPVPEPSTFVLGTAGIVIGLVCAGVRRGLKG
jgi:hypothetical protein